LAIISEDGITPVAFPSDKTAFDLQETIKKRNRIPKYFFIYVKVNFLAVIYVIAFYFKNVCLQQTSC
jgi:hypothetical protein